MAVSFIHTYMEKYNSYSWKIPDYANQMDTVKEELHIIFLLPVQI